MRLLAVWEQQVPLRKTVVLEGMELGGKVSPDVHIRLGVPDATQIVVCAPVQYRIQQRGSRIYIEQCVRVGYIISNGENTYVLGILGAADI